MGSVDVGNVILDALFRGILYVRLVIDRDLIDVEVDGEEESTRIAARRRQNLIN